MDLSATLAAAAYPPTQGHAQQFVARGNGAAVKDYPDASGGNRRLESSRADLSRSTPESQQVREETARKKDPAAEVASFPGFSFEYMDSQQVMKVHNAKGVLIYQVPSKGQLALIQAEDSANQAGQQLRLTA